MSLPFYLMPDYPVEPEDEMTKAMAEYVKHFGVDDIMTEAFSFSRTKWANILKKCVKTNKRFCDYMGIEYDFRTDVDY